MPLWKNTQHAFVAGQLDDNVMGRQDLDKYARGATKLTNFLVKRQGCISKRRGTDLTADLENLLGTTYAGTAITPDKMRLVPVVNNDDGRYVIMSGGIGFVANRDGVMLADTSHTRAVDQYVAQDANGNAKLSAHKDSRASDETPVDVIHTISAGNYQVTRYGDTVDSDGTVTSTALENAIAGASSGDTLRLHGNLTLEPKTNSSNVYVSTPTTVTKSLTIDLYGYRITQYTRNAYICVTSPDIDLTVTSTRPGAEIVTLSNGNSYWLRYQPYTSGTTRSGTLTLDGDITWRMIGHGANMGILVNYAQNVIINGGTFSFDSTTYQGSVFLLKACQNITVNGGTFEILNASDTTIATAQGSVAGDSKTIFLLSVGSSTSAPNVAMTINGGTFVNENTNGSSSAIVNASTGNTTIYIYGGRFDAHAESAYFLNCAFSRNVSSLVNTKRVVIARAELAHPTIRDTYLATNQSIDLFCNYGGDVNSTTATEITFEEVGVTATASDWTLSDESESLTFRWTSSGWQVYGTDSSGTRVNEYASGTPADTEVTFTCGITATRTWSFSDDGEWQIIYANSHWAIYNSELNATSPNGYGYYGVHLFGEEDYTLGNANNAMPYRFAIPYADADLADLCIRQSGDTLFIAHRSYPPAKIYFDSTGRATFEVLQFDSTELLPPVIDSAAMSGQDPVETEWAAEFPTYDSIESEWDATGVPSWISDNTFDTDGTGSSNVNGLTRLEDFVTACKALGTVTDAGYSGNASHGNDGSATCAGTYSITTVNKDLSTGIKTTTVSVLSFTMSTSVERSTTYVNGTAQSTTESSTTTSGTASNSASASIVLVPRTVKYVATYVKDGRESRPSAVWSIDYDLPWANNAVVNLAISKGENDDEPDYYNIYKDNGNGYGLIGTVGVESAVGTFAASVDEYSTYIPDNAASAMSLPCLADYAENRGIGVDTVMRKVCSGANVTFSSSPAGDASIICPPSSQSTGLTFTFPNGTRFKRVRVYLDGRIYDKESMSSYILPSAPQVKLYATYKKSDGTTATMTLGTNGYLFNEVKVSSSVGFGYWSSYFHGIFSDWLMLPRTTITFPNGDTTTALCAGNGDCAEYLNAHKRYLDFDLSDGISAATDFASIATITLKFSASMYSDWNSRMGVVRAMKFYASASDGVDGGNFQDDYINPDMTVTPPGTEDPHFAAAGDYPGSVGLYFQRLVFASTENDPSTLWMSRVADLYNFTAHESIREDDALELTLAATEFPRMNHLIAGRDLMLFGDGGEWLIAPLSGNALTYKTASAKLQSMIGSDRSVQPLQLADETLFAERGGNCLRTINYNYASDSYQTRDLSVIAQSIFRSNPIVSMAYKQHPDSIVECVLEDGTVATLVYMAEQEVAAWSVQELGGGWLAKEIVTPKCIVDGTTEMMLLVERDGVYQLWKVRNDVMDGTAANTVVLDGLHVEESTDDIGDDETYVALGDGTYAVGYPVVSEFVSVSPEPEQGATAQFEVKNATESEVRVRDATTFEMKPYAIDSGWREVSLPATQDGEAVTLNASDAKRLLTGSNNRDGRIHLRHSEAWPLTILSVSTTYQIEYENGGDRNGR